jgi:hypothetical protein
MSVRHGICRCARLAVAAAIALLALAAPAAAAGDGGATQVVEVVLTDRDEVDRLVATGVDLTHEVEHQDGAWIAQAVVTGEELESLRADGFRTGETVWTETDSQAAVQQRTAAIERKRAEAEATAVAAGEVRILRADWFTSTNGQFLNVEAKAASESVAVTVSWDSGPGTPMGSGGTTTLQAFVDPPPSQGGIYLYHFRQFPVTVRPAQILVSSSDGGSATAAVSEWLPLTKSPNGKDPYYTDFVDHYMDPTELYARIEALAAEFPHFAEIVELPYETNGYRRKAQALIGATTPPSVQASAFYVTSVAWGSEGGNDVWIEVVKPGTANQSLTIARLGSYVRVSLATNAAGAATSTAADVVAALNANVSDLLTASTYRGNAGAGIVAPRQPTQLSDFLDAPPHISRQPWTVRAIRIGKHRDGSRMGVMAYAQEHAREWVPPLVAVETAERLLRNYAHDGYTKKLLDNLEVFIVPSANPDGSHYSFYDFAFQRRTMFNHCGSAESDPARRDQWGVDQNRNYDIGSLFDGFFGASSSCRSDVYSGPSELSEPESRNIVWLASTFDNIKFAMNLHSSGNYFMWSPGAYSMPGRVTLPRPTLAEETFFYGASAKILTEIKRYRGLSVTPARTGPIVDVLYSAAGNSGDRLWYGNGIFAWNFEVGGAGFQPAWNEAHAQTMEFSNGLVALFDVAYSYLKDKQRPGSQLVLVGPRRFRFETSEAATVFYTLDGSRPTLSSTKYASAGVREGGETITVSAPTTVRFFSVDAAGNVEGNYDPAGHGQNYNTTTVP